MDPIADNWKKYPLLVIGDLTVSLPEATPISALSLGNAQVLSLHNFYVLVCAQDAELPSLVARLEELQLSPTQIILLLRPETTFSHSRLAFLGEICQIDGENADEFRARLLGKLDAQRQKKISFALQEAMDAGVSRRLAESELALSLDACRISHALACSFSLSPAAHDRVLRRSLEKCEMASRPWPNDISSENLIGETSLLLLDCFLRGKNFRDSLKEKSIYLPFRARNELLRHIETSLGFLLGGKSHVA